MSEDPTMPPEEDTEDGVVAQSAGSIRHKFKQAAFRHLKVLLAKGLADRPSNCTHNCVRVLPSGRLTGLCRCGDFDDDHWPGICDDKLTPEQSEKCEHFATSQTKDEIKEEFRSFLATAQLYEIASRYPDLAPLLWVLGEDAPGRELEVGDWDPGEEVKIEIYNHVFTAANAEEAEKVVEILSDLERGARDVREKLEGMGIERDRAIKRADSLQEERDAIQEENRQYHKDLIDARDERDEWKVKAESVSNPMDLPTPTGFKGMIWRWLTEAKS